MKIDFAILQRVVFFAFILLNVSHGHAFAEFYGSDGSFHILRYEDDFSPKATPSPQKYKYIPLADGECGPTYVSFGGELRERYEGYHNINFGLNGAPAHSDYVLQRVMLHSDLHVTDWVRAFVQVGDMRRWGVRGVPSSTDVDHLELMQGFIDFKIASPLGDQPQIRFGREELAFGSQRLIAVREGPNVRRDFDGLRITDRIGDAVIDFINVHPTSNDAGTLNDGANPNQKLTGIYATTPMAGPLQSDVYWLNYQKKKAILRGATGTENRDTFGLRLFGEDQGFDWNFEAAYQSGSFNHINIAAYMVAAAGGYTFDDVPGKPRLGFSSNYASGDKAGSGSIGTFNPLYVRLPYFAATGLLVPSNIQDVRGIVSFHPAKDTTVTFGYDQLWRASKTDGIYSAGLNQYLNTAMATGMALGSEATIDLRWNIRPDLQFGVVFAEFTASDAIKQVFGKDVTFTSVYAKYRF